MKIINRRARYQYHFLEKIEAGIELTGPEVKSIIKGRMKLENSFVKIKDDQAWLVNAHIAPYQVARNQGLPLRLQRTLVSQREWFAQPFLLGCHSTAVCTHEFRLFHHISINNQLFDSFLFLPRAQVLDLFTHLSLQKFSIVVLRFRVKSTIQPDVEPRGL